VDIRIKTVVRIAKLGREEWRERGREREEG
jgi:hypothetical protein